MEDSASNDFGDFDAFDSTGTSAAKQDSKTKDNNDVDSTSDDFGDFGAFDSETKPSDSPECKSNPELKDNKNTDSASNDFGDFGAFDNNTNSATELKFESEFKNNENAGFDDFGSFDSNTTNAIETKTSDSEKGNTNAESSSSNFGDFGAFDSNTNNATELKSESEFKNNENSGFDDFGAFDSNTTNNAIETKTSDSEKGNTNAESSSSEFGDFGAFDSNTCATKETKFGDFGTAEQEMESVNGFADFGGFAESKPTNDFGNFGNFEDQSGKSTKKTTSVAVQLCQKTLEHTLKVSDSEQNDDDNTRKRIYDLLEHVKNTFVPDTEVSFWEEMQIVKKDEDYWSIHYFSSHFFKHQINALELDYKEIKPKSSIGKHLSTPSLSPATSIGSFDMELGILQPQLVNPKNTLLAQSQNKKVSSALIERLPSLSSLHKESGSEPTSETTSLDLDFFLGGPKDETTEAQQPASTKPPPSSSAIFDLENMDVSSAPENTENSKSLQMDNEFSMFESSSPPPPQQSNDEEVFQTDSQISMDVSKNSLETVNQPKSISPESALSSSEIPFPGNASVESKTSLFIDASKALITPQSFGIDFLAREPPPINSFNDDSKIANEISNAQNSDGFGDFAASGISNLKSDSINLDNQFSTFSTFQDAQSGPPVDDKYSVFADVSTETGKSSVFEKSEEELKSDLQNALTTQSKKPELLENTGESTKPTGGDDFSGFSSFAQPEQQTSGTSIVKDFGEFSDCEKSNNSSNTNKQSSGKTSDFEGFSSFTEPPNKSTNQDAFANFGSFESIPSGSLSKTEFSTDFESNEFDDFSDNKTTGTDFDDFKSTQENQSANSAKTSDTKIESKPSDNSIDSNFGDFSVIQSDSNKQTDFTSFETCAPSTESFGDFSTGFAEFSTSSNDPKKSPSFSVDPSDKSSFSAFSTVSKTLSNPENAFANFSSPLNGTTTTASVSSDPGNTSFGDFSTFDNTSSQTIDQNQQISMLQSQSSIDAATTSDKYDIFINISDQPSTNQPIGIQSSLSDNNDFGAFSDPAPSSISSNFNHQSASSISISNKDFGEFSDASLLTTSSFKQPSMESSVPDSTIQITSIPSNMGLDHSSSFAQFSSTPQSSNNDFGAFSDTQSQSFGQFSSTTTNMNVPSSNYGQTPSSNINDFGAFEDNITSSQPSQPSSDFAHFSTSSNNPKPTTDTSSNDFGAFSDSTQPAKTSADFGRFPISPSTYNVKENAFGAFSDSITPPPPSDFAQFSSPASSSNDFDDFSSSTTTQPPSSDFGKFPSVTTATTSTLTTSTIPTTSSNTSNYFGAISNTLQPLAPTLSNDSDKYTAFSNLNQSTSSSTPELHQTTDDKYSVFSNVNVTGFSDFSSNQTNENIQQAPTNNFGNINSNPIPSSTTSNDFGDFSSASFTNTTTTDSTQIAFPTNNGFITNASFSTAQQSSNNDQFGSFNTPLPQSSSNLQMSQQSFSSAPVSSQQTPNQDFGAFNNLPMPTSVQSSSNEDFGTFNSAPNNPGFAEFSSAPRVTNTSIQSQPIQNSNDFGAFNHSAQLPSNQSDFSGFTSFASKQPPNNQIVPPNNFSMSQQSQSSHSTSQSDFGDFSTAPSNSFGSFQHQQNFNNPQQQAYNTQQIPQQTTRWNQQNQFGAQSQQMYQTNSNPKFGQRFPQSNQQNPSNPRFQAPNNPQQFYGGYQQRQMNPGNHQQHGQVRQGNPQSRGPGTYNRQPKADDPFASLSLVDNAKQLSLSVNNLNRKTKRSLNSMSTTKSGKS
ncbi:dentin sialophosphoprotein-like [Clytia hemisphaerica]|uniref:Uncharacterized protein n=1 Tax=Clytia hemisphaerica TaxID=252671 RepID=A0A7M5XL54_9CNID